MPCSHSRCSNHPPVDLNKYRVSKQRYRSSKLENCSDMPSFSGKADRTSGRASCTLSNGDAVVDGSSPGANEFFLRLIICKFDATCMLCPFRSILTLVGYSCN